VPSREGAGPLPALLLEWGQLPSIFSKGDKHMQASSEPSRRKPCPPHTPLLVRATEEGHCVVQCLACGLHGPERENSSKARLTFEQFSKWLE
jgi:hypothetical protein